ncbi:hypothetical protein ACQ4PT_058037 [Festuca glaucescens]
MYLSSDEIPRPIEHISRGVDVILTKIDPLSHASERFDDLDFAIHFSDWRVRNYLQFQEAVDLDKCLSAMVHCLVNLRAAENEAEEGEALSQLHAAALKLKELSLHDSSEVGMHTLTASSPALRTIGLPLSVSAFGVHEAAPDSRPVLLDKLVNELELVRASPFPLEFRRFSGAMPVSSLRDVRHALSVTQPPPNPTCSRTNKVLISGARLREAREMLDMIEENREVAGWDVSESISDWKQGGWEIYTPTTYQKLILVIHVDDVLRDLHSNFYLAREGGDEHLGDLLQFLCEKSAEKLIQAHVQDTDLEALDLPGVTHDIRQYGFEMTVFCSDKLQDLLFSRASSVCDRIASVRECQVHFSVE